MKKRFLAAALALCLVFSCIGGVPAQANKYEMPGYDYLINLGGILPLFGWRFRPDGTGCELKEDGTMVIYAGVYFSATWPEDYHSLTIYVNKENYVTALQFDDTTPPVLQAFFMEMTHSGVVYKIYEHLSPEHNILPSYDAYLLEKWKDELKIVSDPNKRITFPFGPTLEIDEYGNITFTI